MTNVVTFLGVAGLYFLGLNVYFQLKKNYGQSNLLEPVCTFVVLDDAAPYFALQFVATCDGVASGFSPGSDGAMPFDL
jgi:hypothetical protein